MLAIPLSSKRQAFCRYTALCDETSAGDTLCKTGQATNQTCRLQPDLKSWHIRQRVCTAETVLTFQNSRCSVFGICSSAANV